MDIKEQLLRDEGLRLKPYKDSAGKLTIGVGRNLDDVGIIQMEAMYLLSNDITKAQAVLEQHLPWCKNFMFDLTGAYTPRFAVLLNMTFNMGIDGLMKFQCFLEAFQKSNWEAASTLMLASLWAKQVGARAQRLSQQLKTGEWQ